ncbi:zinc ribbon domain-containing protein [Nicoliella lavandulae]|uniref:Zinc ribbon domain-containing protein n=1 Tax=Nicoliella lavandulae TaxID=3082954 RepID=A0ABU8SJW0_9LACO
MAEPTTIQCPRCHHDNDATNEFCDYCGLDLAKYFDDGEEVQPTLTVADSYTIPNYQSRLKKYSKKDSIDRSKLDLRKFKLTFHSFKHRKRWAFSAAALIFVVGGYTYGQFYYSKSITLNRVDSSVAKDQLDDYFVTKHNEPQATKVIAEYFKANPAAADRLKRELKSNGHTSDGFFTYQKTGTHFGIFPKYQVVLNNQELEQQTYSIKIKTKPYALILLNGKLMSYADENGNYELTHLTTDHFELNAKYHVDDHGVTTEPIKVNKNDNGRTITLIRNESGFDQNQAQATLNQVYTGIQSLTNQRKTDMDLGNYFLYGNNNHYYQSMKKLALIFNQYQFKAKYTPQITTFKRDGQHRYHIVYNLKYEFDSGDQVHVQIFRTIAEVQQDHEHHYKVASVISDATPIKDKYYHK